MTAFRFPQPGERYNAAAVLVPESLLRDLVLSVVNGDANSICEGCSACDLWHYAARQAFQLLSFEDQAEVWLSAHALGVDLHGAWGLE